MLDRAAAVVETVALALWIGALAGFAFVVAPAAFHAVSNRAEFAHFAARAVRALTYFGFACGAIALANALVRTRLAPRRALGVARLVAIAAALALSAYELYAIVPAMEVTPIGSPPYRALHDRSSSVYGGALLLGVLALALGTLDGRFGAPVKPRHAR